jgi:hypothetical protein
MVSIMDRRGGGVNRRLRIAADTPAICGKADKSLLSVAKSVEVL